MAADLPAAQQASLIRQSSYNNWKCCKNQIAATMRVHYAEKVAIKYPTFGPVISPPTCMDPHRSYDKPLDAIYTAFIFH